MSSPSLSASFAYCRRLTRSRSSNFYYAFYGLPPRKRQALFALYAWLRVLDDLGDDSSSPADAKKRIQAFKAETERQIAKGSTPTLFTEAHGSLWPAFTATVHDFDIPPAYLAGTIDGVLDDQAVTRYATMADLESYCFKVASLVGFMCLRIFGNGSPESEALGKSLGLAFQTTNILRDVAEDARLGRIYLPQELLRAHGISDEDVLMGRDGPGLRAALATLADVSERHYLASLPLIDLVPADARPSLRLMFNSYYRLLERIRARGFDVLSGRVRMGWADKARVLYRSFVRKELLVDG